MTPTQAEAARRRKAFHAEIAAKAAAVGSDRKNLAPEAMPAEVDPPFIKFTSGIFTVPLYAAPIGSPIHWDVAYNFALATRPVETAASRYSIEAIKKTVAGYYGLTHAQLISPRRFKGIVRARMVIAYLADKLMPISYSEIARRLGGRDHTTIMHAVKRLEPLCCEDAEFAADVAEIIELVTGQAG